MFKWKSKYRRYVCEENTCHASCEKSTVSLDNQWHYILYKNSLGDCKGHGRTSEAKTKSRWSKSSRKSRTFKYVHNTPAKQLFFIQHATPNISVLCWISEKNILQFYETEQL